MPPTLYLIDGHALAYRTYYALTSAGTNTSRWITRSGEPTAGVYGFTSVLLRIFEQDRPDYLAVAFDVGKTFRDEMYPEYKATREKMPDDLRVQIERIRQLVDTFNIPRLEMEGYEADDILGSAARSMAALGLGVKIITGDRDLLQLVDERIVVSLSGRRLSDSKDYTAEDVKETLGVYPHQVVDYKAMVGDTSDNIPGVKGVGKKTAASLLNTYGTLDEVYNHLDDLKPGVRNKLLTDRENAILSRKLAAIVTDLEINVDLENARIDRFDPGAVKDMFHVLEFRSLINRLNTVTQVLGMLPAIEGEQYSMFDVTGDVNQTSGIDTRTVVVDTKDALEELVKQLEMAEIIAFDTETTSTDQMNADLVGISLAVKGGEGYYIPVGHRTQTGRQLQLQAVLDALRSPMTDPSINKAGHNVKYDYVVLARHNLIVRPLGFDSMIAEWVCDPSSRNLGLKNLSWVRLGLQMTDIESLIGKGKQQISMADVPIERAAPYAAADAEVVLRLMPGLLSDLEAREGKELFYQVEMPLVETLAKMEMAGISLDIEFLSLMSTELNERMSEIRIRVFEVVGEEFNLNSTQQLSRVLFGTLKLSPPDGTRKTASGHYSTSAAVLEAIRKQHPVVQWILEYRGLAKLKSTYIDALPNQLNADTGRVHTSYNQTGTVTGRIASTDPNLQNIPIRTEQGRRVREGFVASPGHLLLSIDYSQVELRIVAHMANDESMLSAFRSGQDIHATTASAIYNIPLDEVTKEQRYHAKAINFGLIYGMSAFGLTRTTNLTLAEAEDFVETYFNRFPGVKHYLDTTKVLAAEQEYVETLLGRRRYFKGLKNQRNRNIRFREEREAINAPIQGTAADIMKRAMLKVDSALTQSGLQARILLQVHDELVLECPEKQLIKTSKIVMNEMESAFKLKVPLITEARAGVNWGKMTILEI
jgi:DNA polymerase-1